MHDVTRQLRRKVRVDVSSLPTHRRLEVARWAASRRHSRANVTAHVEPGGVTVVHVWYGDRTVFRARVGPDETVQEAIGSHPGLHALR